MRPKQNSDFARTAANSGSIEWDSAVGAGVAESVATLSSGAEESETNRLVIPSLQSVRAYAERRSAHESRQVGGSSVSHVLRMP